MANLSAVAGGTLFGIAQAPFFGPIYGYAIDAFRDLTGIEPSSRLPSAIRRLSLKVKKYIAVGIVIASISTSALIYKLTPNKYKLQSNEQPRIEQVTNITAED